MKKHSRDIDRKIPAKARLFTAKRKIQYILKQQMQTAGELLKSGQFRIGEPADYCGFNNIASFTRSFKHYYRVSPRKWLAGYLADAGNSDPD